MIDGDVFNEYAYLITMTLLVFLIPVLRTTFVPIPSSTKEIINLKKDANGRYIVFDILRGIAILSVVVIHVVYIFLKDKVVDDTAFLNAVNASFRFALPIFFITSGLLLKPPIKTTVGYFSFLLNKSISLLPAYILVTGILAFIQNLSLNNFFYNVVTGKGAVPLYFVIVLFQLYVIYPFLFKWAQKRWFVYFSFYLSMFFQFLPSSWYIFDILTAFPYIFFFVWGIYMREQLLSGTLRSRWLPWSIMLVFCILVYTMFPGMYYNMRPFFGLAVMMLLYQLFTSSCTFKKSEQILAWIGSMSLWIFLTHFSLLEFILPYLWKTIVLPIPLLIFTTSVFSILISVIFGYICTQVYNNILKVFT